MFDITKEEKEYIERYINKKFDQNDFFIFNIKLCDNEVDEDLECFSVSSLEKLALFYKGKLGILNLIDESQYPRIFNCKIKKFSNKKTKIGNNYIELIAKAYISINKETENIIYNIKNNLLKEISVGCLIKKTICPICRKEFNDFMFPNKNKIDSDGKSDYIPKNEEALKDGKDNETD